MHQKPLLSLSEENYLKAIYKLLEKGQEKISTNSISEMVATSPASVTDMLRKLAEKKLINYAPYKGVTLTAAGKRHATGIVRKHRLWELFLVEKLKYSWDEVHEIAEQLEHIQSESLVKRLDAFLGTPKFDPHGDPIPDDNGNIETTSNIPLSNFGVNQQLIVSGVFDHSTEFLKYLAKLGITTGTELTIKEVNPFDHMLAIRIKGNRISQHISHEVALNIRVAAL